MGGDHGGKTKPAGTGKKIAFFTIGSLTLLYCLGELAVALYINSLALLSDGFHNLSDVVSLYIAWWAQNAAQRDQSDDMSYGWGRTEILGGLSNGCFLLSLCLYVTLEAIPKMIRPEADGLDCSGALSCERVYELFILVAAAGLFVNTLGTIIFAFVGLSHGHSHSHGHGHGHGSAGGHGHSHGHSHGKKKAKKDKVKGVKGTKKEAQSLLGSINDEESEHEFSESESEHEHDHAHGHDHGHSHGHKHEKKEKKDKKDHKHDHDHKHKDHDHPHKEHKEHKHDHDHEHGHKKDKKKKEMHTKDHKKKGFFARMDLNMGAVFIHYLGDTVSSLVVLATGFMLHYLKGSWINYIDPVSSLVIVVLIVASTVPLVKRCSMILLQSVPDGIDTDKVRQDIGVLDHVVSIHDLHIWQLVDGMVIASVHLLVEDTGNLGDVLYHVKKIFHGHGIHSTSIQPELVPVTSPKQGNFCAQNCVEDCEEDWCCKNTADRTVAAAITV